MSGKKIVLIERLKDARGDVDSTRSSTLPSPLSSTSISLAPRSVTDYPVPSSAEKKETVDTRGGGDVSGSGNEVVQEPWEDGVADNKVVGNKLSAAGGGGGAVKRGLTLRERLEARVRDRAAGGKPRVSSSTSTSSSSISSSSQNMEEKNDKSTDTKDVSVERGGKAQARSDFDQDVLIIPVKQVKQRVGPLPQSSGKGDGKPVAVVTTAATKTMEGPPVARTPLSALGQGDSRVGNRGDSMNGSGSGVNCLSNGKANGGTKTAQTKPVVATTQAARKAIGGSNGNASGQRKPVLTSSSFRPKGGVTRQLPSNGGRVSTTTKGGFMLKTGKSERMRVLSNRPGGGRTKVTSATVAASSLSHGRQVKVDGGFKAAGTMPSFLKPTKSSGAHVSASLQARSGGGGSSVDDAAS